MSWSIDEFGDGDWQTDIVFVSWLQFRRAKLPAEYFDE
jgi:hypothetical protein